METDEAGVAKAMAAKATTKKARISTKEEADMKPFSWSKTQNNN
jgi:hypothetical protein